jgi:hypothetical protein
VSIVVLNIGFLFNRTFTPLRDYSLRSDVFDAIQSKVSFVVPVPYPYLQGLDWIIERERNNAGFGPVYLLGEARVNEGFPGYYFVVFLKVLATQIIFWRIVVYFWTNPQENFE